MRECLLIAGFPTGWDSSDVQLKCVALDANYWEYTNEVASILKIVTVNQSQFYPRLTFSVGVCKFE